MKIRNSYIEKERPLANSGTVVMDITTVTPIQIMFLVFEAKNHATSNHGNSLVDKIKRVEITDGSNTIYAATAREAQAASWYHHRVVNNNNINEKGGAVQKVVVPIAFSRGHEDLEYYFDPTRYTNPQLKVTWDIGDVGAIDQFVSGSVKLSVLAQLLTEKPSTHVGMLTQKQLASFLSDDSGERRVRIPTDKKFYSLFFRAYLAGNKIHQIIDNVKLTADNDAFIPFDMKTIDNYFLAHKEIPFEQYPAVYVVQDAEVIDVDFSGNTCLTVGNISGANIISATRTNSGRETISALTDVGVADVTDKEYSVICSGLVYHHTFYLRQGSVKSPETYFDPAVYGSLALVLNQVKAGAGCSVFIAQVELF